jgi:hypothetical protein
MRISSPELALDSIRKASKWEPNEKYLPRYLKLQSELEMGFGDKSKAMETLKLAKKIIRQYNDFWYSDAQKDIVRKINELAASLEEP